MATTQSRCGARTLAGTACRNRAVIGTSRCAKHQGPWSSYGVAQRKEKEAKAKKRQIRKKR